MPVLLLPLLLLLTPTESFSTLRQTGIVIDSNGNITISSSSNSSSSNNYTIGGNASSSISNGTNGAFENTSFENTRTDASFSVSLYAANGGGSASEDPLLSSSYREILPSEGGQIVPVVRVDASIAGIPLDTLIGGFRSTEMDWSGGVDRIRIARIRASD